MANAIEFKPVVKDKLFYDRFQYCISFMLDEASALKTLDHDYINAVIDRRKTWRQMAVQRWNTSKGHPKPQLAPIIMSRRWREITDKTTEDLHDLADILIKTSADFKLVTSVDQVWIYTNNLTFVKRLGKLSYITDIVYTEALVTRPKDTIKLKDPKHTHRSYFKSVKLTQKEKENITGFFANQTGHIRISPSLVAWLSTPYYRTQDYFFIDHTGDSWLLMLALIKSGLIRKTSEIIPA